MENLQCFRQEIRGDDAHAADAELPAMAGLGLIGALDGTLGVGQEFLGVLQENFARLRQGDADRITI
jgi:hypothetical protein